jgi:hypothetical protein
MNVWDGIIIIILSALVWWFGAIIKSMAEEIATKRTEVSELKKTLRNNKYELDALKQSIINTGTVFFPKDSIPASQLSPKLLNKLIQFCHPDKHNNDPKAGMLTAELIKIKHSRGIQ